VDPDRLPWDYSRLTAELRPDAERAVRRALLLEAIAEREEIAVDEAEVEAEIARLARDAGRAPQAMRSLLERGGDLTGLRLALREQKTLAFLIQHADVQPAESTVPGAAAPEA
jgi:trigger factor